MKNKKVTKNLLIGLLVLIILIPGGYFGVRYYKKLTQGVTPVYHAVPVNSSAVIELKHPGNFWEYLKNQNIAKQLQDITEIDRFFKKTDYLDSLLKQDEDFKRWVQKKPLLLSLHYRGGDHFSYLGLLQLSNTRQEKKVIDFIGKHSKISKTGDEPYTYYKAEINDSLKFYFSVPEGILIASMDRDLLQQSLTFLKKEQHILTIAEFRKVYKARGKDVEANVFFNHRGLHRYLSRLAGDDYVTAFSNWSNYAGWAEADLMMSDDGLWFSGNTLVNDTAKHYLKIFKDQNPGNIKMTDILPARTALLSYYSYDDFNTFYPKYKQKLDKADEQKKYVTNFNAKYDLNLNEYFLSWIDDEFARCVVSDPQGKYYNYAIVRARDTKEAKQSLDKISGAIRNTDRVETDTMNYRGVEIGHLKNPYLLRMFLGKKFDVFKQPYYTILDEYVVFSGSKKAAQYAINQYMLENTLNNNKQYLAFADKIAGQANIYLYYNLRYGKDFLASRLDVKARSFLLNNTDEINDIPLGGFQYQYQGDKIYTNFYFKSDTARREVSSGWQLALEAPLACKPEFVVDHYTKQKKIVAFDKQKQMYLININGKIEWKIRLKELPVGGVEMIDYYNNGKYQYLFNTPSYVYCIALNGKHVEGFPFQTDVISRNPLSAFDYKNTSDYRILMAGKDKYIYNYRKDGSQVEGWQKYQSDHLVLAKIQRIVLDNKDFIIVADTAGGVHFLSRRGVKRIVPQPAFTNNSKIPFYKLTTDGKQVMMTTDKDGRIIFIDKEGKVDKFILNEFSPNFEFEFADYDRDGKRDFIFLDNNSLYVYNQDYQIIEKREFDFEVLGDIKDIPHTQDSIRLILRKTNQEVVKIKPESLETFKDPVFSQFPVLVYDKSDKRGGNLIISTDKRIESIPLSD
ncbi:MAG: DUF3352 domain-containing protein [Bacteroidales bacterium]|nr:DUF3352 domain-containing protein [Bacteroidales bacterium]